MIEIDKLVIGIRPSSRMFRVSTFGGQIIDTILSARGSKILEDEYFSEVSTNHEQGSFRLQNESEGNELRIDQTNIIFSNSAYQSGKKIKIDQFINEFTVIWKFVNEILKINDIRRIGLYASNSRPPHKLLKSRRPLFLLS